MRPEFSVLFPNVSVLCFEYDVRTFEQVCQSTSFGFAVVNLAVQFVVELYLVGVPVERVLFAQAQFIFATGGHGHDTDTAVVARTFECDERSGRHIMCI